MVKSTPETPPTIPVVVVANGNDNDADADADESASKYLDVALNNPSSIDVGG